MAQWKMKGSPSATPPPDNSSLTPDSFMATQTPAAAASPAALTPDSFMAQQGKTETAGVITPQPGESTWDLAQRATAAQIPSAVKAMQMGMGGGGIQKVGQEAFSIGDAAAPYVDAFLNKPSVKPIVDLLEKEAMKIPGADIAKKGWQVLSPWLRKAAGTGDEPPATFPGAPNPPTPPAEVLQANPLTQGATPTPPAPPSQTGEALGTIPAPWRMKPQAAALADAPATSAAPATARQFTNKVGPMIDESLGNPPVAKPAVTPGQPIYRRTAASAAPSPAEGSVPTGNIPEGHTAVEGSNAVKSFKYDPDAQELHIAPTKGYTYVYGDVSPEQAAQFQNAESKGRAWLSDPDSIKNSNPLVAKIHENGTRTAMKTSAAASGDDLTGKLQQSVDAAQKAKWKMKAAQ